MYGLSSEWLVRGGVVVPSVVVLAHTDELRRLAAAVPDAVPVAVVAGDPCLDRLDVSRPRRREYRAALGARDGDTVVFVSSTWGPRSLFGRHPGLLADLVSEVELDSVVVCAALHPNAWFAHGPGQIRAWLADAVRAGLRLVPPARGWQQALLAADVTVGDHGAVTAYSAALGVPTLLATFPGDDVVADSAVGVLGRSAERLDLRRPFGPQLRSAVSRPRRIDDVRARATSEPGRSMTLLRRRFYELMDLPVPESGPVEHLHPPEDLVPIREHVRAWWAHGRRTGARRATLRRWAADVPSPPGGPHDGLDRHLVVTADHPRRDLQGLASVVLLDRDRAPSAVFAERPACRWTVQQQPDGYLVSARSGREVLLRATGEGPHEAAAAAAGPCFDDRPGTADTLHVTVAGRTVALAPSRVR